MAQEKETRAELNERAVRDYGITNASELTEEQLHDEIAAIDKQATDADKERAATEKEEAKTKEAEEKTNKEAEDNAADEADKASKTAQKNSEKQQKEAKKEQESDKAGDEGHGNASAAPTAGKPSTDVHPDNAATDKK